jgi:hypothetical protein
LSISVAPACSTSAVVGAGVTATGAGAGGGGVGAFGYYPPNKVFFSVFAPVSKPCDDVLIPEYVTPVPLANVLDFFFIPSADTSTDIGVDLTIGVDFVTGFIAPIDIASCIALLNILS